MKERKQKNPLQGTCPQKNRTESEGYVGGQTYIGIAENNLTDTHQLGYGLLEFIVSPSNLNAAYRQVKRNKGAGGVDKMEVESLKDYLVSHKDELLAAIEKGKYCPNPVRRVEIPKDNGSKRQLGIPTVVDRVIQQSISQVLTPIYEPQFSSYSYGFRPKRNAHQALVQCRKYITEGYSYAVDIDLEKFFDKVNHSKLIEVLSRKVKDGRVISLIHKYLNAGVVVKQKFEPTRQGVPQGGPLSPLLSNIMLNELDKLEDRGHKFVRYADDMVILCRSIRSARRILESVQKMKAKIKELTSRSNGWGNERRKEALRQYITGWVQYFKLADMKDLLIKTDEWYRRRIRMVIWKQWKRIRTKLKNLIKLGINKSKAWEWANTRKGYWRIAHSFILSRTITTVRLRKAGYVFLSDYYRKVRVVN
jgi:RNA-directed DNA polymerase